MVSSTEADDDATDAAAAGVAAAAAVAEEAEAAAAAAAVADGVGVDAVDRTAAVDDACDAAADREPAGGGLAMTGVALTADGAGDAPAGAPVVASEAGTDAPLLLLPGVTAVAGVALTAAGLVVLGLVSVARDVAGWDGVCCWPCWDTAHDGTCGTNTFMLYAIVGARATGVP